MKILIFNTLYYPNSIGGAEKSVQALTENLFKLGNEVAVVSTTYGDDYIGQVNGIKVYYISNRNLYWGFDQEDKPGLSKLMWHTIDSLNFRLKTPLKEILNIEKPDIIHTNNLCGLSVLIWKLARQNNIKVVHTVRDYYLACPSSTMYINNQNCKNQCIKCKIFSLPRKRLSTSINAVVGISNYVLEKHISLGYFRETEYKTVIGNDVGPVKDNNRVTDGSNIIFGFIGQLTDAKGIIQLLNTFQKLRTFNNWKLFIAGKGESNFTKSLVMKFKSERIEFLGVVDSEKFYNEIDVLIVPSVWQEPFGRVVAEGIRNNKYVIGSKRGGISELLIENDLYEPESNELLEKVTEILKSKIVPIQKNSFDIDVTSKYIQLYKKMLAK